MVKIMRRKEPYLSPKITDSRRKTDFLKETVKNITSRRPLL